jgi:hypothetical protein
LTNPPRRSSFVVCVDAQGYDDLLVRRIYQVLPDPSAARSKFIRIIDDSGEDYLYPATLFLRLRPSSTLLAALHR